MPEFTLDVYGKEYVIDAPDQKSAVDAALGHYQSNYGQPQQPAVGPSPYAENVGMLEKPIEFQGRPTEEVKATLGDFVPPPELAADLLKAKSPQGGAPTQSNVQAITEQIQKTGSIRDVLNKEVASGALDPKTTLDPQQYPVLAPIWEQYKQEMEPSFLGAMVRGAESQAGAVVGGAIGAGIGAIGAPITGPVTPFLGRMGGAVAGAEIQKAAESAFRTPQEQAAAAAQAVFDASRAATRTGTAIGEVAPHLLTMRPALNTIERAMSGDTQAITQVAMGSVLGAAVPAATGGGIERTVVGAITGGVMEPRIAPRTSAVTPRQLESIAAAEQAGIPVYTQDVFRPQGRTGQALQRAGEVLPMGTTGQRVAGQQATQAAVEKTLKGFSVEMSDLGQTKIDPKLAEVFKSFESRRKEIRNKFKTDRENAMQKAKSTGISVDLTNSLPAIDNAINEIKSNLFLKDVVQTLETAKESLSKDSTLKNVESVRKSIGEAFKNPSLANIKSQGEATVEGIYGPINEDIASFIQTHGNPSDLTKWRIANDKLHNLAKQLNIDAINHVLDAGKQTPEIVKKLIFNAPESTQAILYSQLNEKGRQNLRTVIMQKAYEDSTFKGEFSAARFLRQIDNISSNLNISFTPSQQAELTGLAKAIQLTERNQRFAPNAETGVQAVPGQVVSALTKAGKTVAVGAIGTGAYMHPVAALATAGLGVGLGATARVYNSQPVRRALVALSTAPQGTQAEQNAYRILTSAIQAEARKSTPKQESK